MNTIKNIIKEVAEEYKPEVTDVEIKEWESNFSSSVYSNVKFDSVDGKPSIRLYKGYSGIEATWSGVMLFESDNNIKWSFSIQNGIFVEAKIKLTDTIINTIENLYSFYDNWKNEWLKVLSVPEAEGVIQENKRTIGNIIKESSNRMIILAGLRK